MSNPNQNPNQNRPQGSLGTSPMQPPKVDADSVAESVRTGPGSGSATATLTAPASGPVPTVATTLAPVPSVIARQATPIDYYHKLRTYENVTIGHRLDEIGNKQPIKERRSVIGLHVRSVKAFIGDDERATFEDGTKQGVPKAKDRENPKAGEYLLPGAKKYEEYEDDDDDDAEVEER